MKMQKPSENWMILVFLVLGLAWNIFWYSKQYQETQKEKSAEHRIYVIE